MATEITSIGLAVDTSQLLSASDAIDHFVLQGSRAETAIQGVEYGFRNANLAIQQNVRHATDAAQKTGALVASYNAVSAGVRQLVVAEEKHAAIARAAADAETKSADVVRHLGTTWKEFAQQRRSAYIEFEGNLIAATQRLSSEWSQLKQNATAAAELETALKAAASAAGTAAGSIGRVALGSIGADTQAPRVQLEPSFPTREAQDHINALRGLTREEEELTAAQEEFISQLQRETAALRQKAELLGLTARETRELQAAQLGLAVKAAPQIDDFAAAQQLLRTKQQEAKASREAEAAEEQAIATKERWLAKLREEIATIGLSQEQKALRTNRQVGGGSEGEDLLEKVRLINAEQAAESSLNAERDRTERSRQQWLAGKQQEIDTLLREQDAYNLTAIAKERLKASESGVTPIESEPIIQEVLALREAKEETERLAAAERAAQATKEAFIRTIEQQAAALRKQNAELGLSEADKLRRGVAEAGLSTEQQTAAGATINDIAALQQSLDTKRQAIRADEQAESAKRAYIASLKAEAAALREAEAAARDKEAGDIGGLGALQRKGIAAGVTDQGALQQEVAALRENAAAREAASKKTQTHTVDVDRMEAALQREIATFGKSREEIYLYDAAVAGATNRIAPLVAQLRKQEEALLSGVQGWRNSARFAVFQRQQLAFQLHDLFVQVVSGGNPFVALVQQGSQLSGTFGGMGNALRAVLAVMSPVKVGLAALGTTVAVLATAWFQGNRAAKEFADNMTLTNNVAGLTAGSFNRMAESIADSSGRSIGDIKEIGRALQGTGEIGPAAFATATEAAERYADITDKTAKETAKDFAQMARDPARWAAESMRAFGGVSLAQIQQINALQENGRASEAQAIVVDQLNKKLKELDGNLGFIDEAWKAIKSSASAAWDAMKGIGAPETVEDNLNRAKKALEDFDKSRGRTGPIGLQRLEGPPGTVLSPEEQQARARQPLADAVGVFTSQAFGEDAAAAHNAGVQALRLEADELNKFGKALRQQVFSQAETDKAVETEQKKVDRLNQLARNEGLAVQVTQQQLSRRIFEIRRAGLDPWIPAGIEARLDRQTREIDRALERQQENLTFHQSALQQQYQGGNISLEHFFDERIAIIASRAKAEADALRAKAAEQQKALDKTPLLTPAERFTRQTGINDLLTQAAQVEREAGHQTALTLQEQAESVEQLNAEVREFQASLLQLRGKDFEADTLRLQTTFQRQRELLVRASGIKPPQVGALEADFARFDRELDAINKQAEAAERTQLLFAEINETKRQISLADQRNALAEERVNFTIEQGALARRDGEQLLFEARSRGIEQLERYSEQMRELAKLSEDPALIQWAEELAFRVEKARASMDPALERLRAFQNDVASTVSGTITSALDDLPQRRQRFKEEMAEIEAERKAARRDLKSPDSDTRLQAARKLNELEEKAAQARRKHAEDMSKLLHNLGAELLSIINKTIIQEPLEEALRRNLRGLTEGGGGVGNFFGQLFGLAAFRKEPDVGIGSEKLTGDVAAQRDALRSMEAKAYETTDALSSMQTQTSAVGAVLQTLPGIAITPTAASMQSFMTLGVNPSTASLVGLKGAADSAALALLAMVNKAGSDLTGFSSSFLEMLTKGGNATGTFATDEALALFFHSGGIVGQGGGERRVINRNSLRSDEVAAVLQRKEEVLRPDDPRHSDNIDPELLQRLKQTTSIDKLIAEAQSIATASAENRSLSSAVDAGAKDERKLNKELGVGDVMTVKHQSARDAFDTAMGKIGGNAPMAAARAALEFAASQLRGFSGGGYTGDGDPRKAVGPVHAREYVFSAPATASIGVATLDALHKAATAGKVTKTGLPGFGDGGFVKPTNHQVLESASHARRDQQPQPVSIEFVNKGTPQREVGREVMSDGRLRIMVDDIIADSFSRGGKASKAAEKTFGLNRGAGAKRLG